MIFPTFDFDIINLLPIMLEMKGISSHNLQLPIMRKCPASSVVNGSKVSGIRNGGVAFMHPCALSKQICSCLYAGIYEHFSFKNLNPSEAQ